MLDPLRQMLHAEAFEPFAIVLTSGRSYDVFSPDQVAVMEQRIFYAYPRSERYAFLRVNQIASLEKLDRAEQS